MSAQGEPIDRETPAACARAEEHGALVLRYLGIDTYQHYIVYARSDCAVCRAEGFAAQSRIDRKSTRLNSSH